MRLKTGHLVSWSLLLLLAVAVVVAVGVVAGDGMDQSLLAFDVPSTITVLIFFLQEDMSQISQNIPTRICSSLHPQKKKKRRKKEKEGADGRGKKRRETTTSNKQQIRKKEKNNREERIFSFSLFESFDCVAKSGLKNGDRLFTSRSAQLPLDMTADLCLREQGYVTECKNSPSVIFKLLEEI